MKVRIIQLNRGAFRAHGASTRKQDVHTHTPTYTYIIHTYTLRLLYDTNVYGNKLLWKIRTTGYEQMGNIIFYSKDQKIKIKIAVCKRSTGLNIPTGYCAERSHGETPDNIIRKYRCVQIFFFFVFELVSKGIVHDDLWTPSKPRTPGKDVRTWDYLMTIFGT